jgi:hypothetical protein
MEEINPTQNCQNSANFYMKANIPERDFLEKSKKHGRHSPAWKYTRASDSSIRVGAALCHSRSRAALIFFFDKC